MIVYKLDIELTADEVRGLMVTTKEATLRLQDGSIISFSIDVLKRLVAVAKEEKISLSF